MDFHIIWAVKFYSPRNDWGDRRTDNKKKTKHYENKNETTKYTKNSNAIAAAVVVVVAMATSTFTTTIPHKMGDLSKHTSAIVCYWVRVEIAPEKLMAEKVIQ